VESTPYNQRQSLLRHLASEDHRWDWDAAFARSISSAEMSLTRLLRERPSTSPRPQNRSLFTRLRRQQLETQEPDLLQRLEIEVPQPPKYTARSVVSDSGAVIAEIRRELDSEVRKRTRHQQRQHRDERVERIGARLERLEDEINHTREQVYQVTKTLKKSHPKIGRSIEDAENLVGTVMLGDDVAEIIAERFQQLQVELVELERRALADYVDALQRTGLDEKGKEDREADLRARALTARERQQLNSGLTSTLNAEPA
jgi:archaellum component FlaC